MSRNFAVAIREEVEKMASAETRRTVKPLLDEVQALRTEIREAKKRLSELEKAPPGRTPPGARGMRFDAESIRELRTEFGYSQADLGAVIGVTPVAVYLWESGRTSPRGRTLAALADLKKGGARKAMAALKKATGETRPSGDRRGKTRRKKRGSKKKTSTRRRKR